MSSSAQLTTEVSNTYFVRNAVIHASCKDWLLSAQIDEAKNFRGNTGTFLFYAGHNIDGIRVNNLFTHDLST